MNVYHGSYTEIETIDFSLCKKRRDFGRGFYVTKLLSQAKYWATRKGEDNDSDGIVTEFEFDEDCFCDEDLKTLRFDRYSETWLDFIVLNRKNRKNVQAHDYDIIEGPVADDDIATRVFDYVNGEVSKTDFLNELKFRKASHQICFCTLQSLQTIKKIEKYDFAYKLKNITRQIIEALVAEKGMDKVAATDKLYNSEIFTKLSDKNSSFYEKKWTDIYKLLLKELNNE